MAIGSFSRSRKEVFSLRILTLEKTKDPHVIEIKAVIGDTEFAQLAGDLDHLCVFAAKSINEQAAATKTGARHSWAKWLLFPKRLQRQFGTDNLNFEDVTCGVVRYLDKVYVVYVVYGIPRKDLVPMKDENTK